MNEFISSEIYNPLMSLSDIKVKLKEHDKRITALEKNLLELKQGMFGTPKYDPHFGLIKNVNI